MRLFIALELPETVRAEMIATQDRLRQTAHPVRWNKADSMHLTLQFLGESAVPLATELTTALAQLEPPTFSLQLAAVGVFPHVRQPRVIWVGITGDLVDLATLQQQVVTLTSALGYAALSQPFVPHLTLGRIKAGSSPTALRTLRTALEQLTPPAPLRWGAGRPYLFQSLLGSQGSAYIRLGHGEGTN
jgi:2'-5' RNA ligase